MLLSVTGPIIRLNPNEVHINDPDFYEDIYAGGSHKRNKDTRWVGIVGRKPLSTFATVEHEHHRMRRSALSKFFSKRSVSHLESVINEKVYQLTQRFNAHARDHSPVRLDAAFTALTMDIITQYAFANCSDYLEIDDYQLAWKELLHTSFEAGPLLMQFPWLFDISKYLPGFVFGRDQAAFESAAGWRRHAFNEVSQILDPRIPDKQSSVRTIFHEIRDSDLPDNEKTVERLSAEGTLLTGAGSETTAKTLSTIVFYLCRHPEYAERLRLELSTAKDSANSIVPSAALEQLPYLTAVIHEGLRLAFGVTTRLPRVSLEEALVYGGFVIPRGVRRVSKVTVETMLTCVDSGQPEYILDLYKRGDIPGPLHVLPRALVRSSEPGLQVQKHYFQQRQPQLSRNQVRLIGNHLCHRTGTNDATVLLGPNFISHLQTCTPGLNSHSMRRQKGIYQLRTTSLSPLLQRIRREFVFL